MPRSAPGDAFGRAVEDYERGRPGWPAEAIDDVSEALSLDRSSKVVDLPAGTGKLTRQLVTRFASVVAVEPDAAMRALPDTIYRDPFRTGVYWTRLADGPAGA